MLSYFAAFFAANRNCFIEFGWALIQHPYSREIKSNPTANENHRGNRDVQPKPYTECDCDDACIERCEEYAESSTSVLLVYHAASSSIPLPIVPRIPPNSKCDRPLIAFISMHFARTEKTEGGSGCHTSAPRFFVDNLSARA
jgi:hypothetical protein